MPIKLYLGIKKLQARMLKSIDSIRHLEISRLSNGREALPADPSTLVRDPIQKVELRLPTYGIYTSKDLP